MSYSRAQSLSRGLYYTVLVVAIDYGLWGKKRSEEALCKVRIRSTESNRDNFGLELHRWNLILSGFKMSVNIKLECLIARSSKESVPRNKAMNCALRIQA